GCSPRRAARRRWCARRRRMGGWIGRTPTGGPWMRSNEAEAPQHRVTGEGTPMAIFEMTQAGLAPVAETRFDAEGLRERADLQRLVRENISILEDGLMVVAEEFGEWMDSSRR